MNNIGLYIHIPFCNSKCPYCDFYSFRADDKELCSELLHRFPQADIKSYPLRGLCSYYAERGGIMLGFEA